MTEKLQTTTIRMRICDGDRTLNGYIFANRDHARQWLSQPFMADKKVQLEEVEVGPMTKCSRCGGSGIHPARVKVLREITIKEVVGAE